MYKSAGLENKEDGALTLHDFKNIMAEHKTQLESATLDLKGVDVAAPAVGPGADADTKGVEIQPAEGATPDAGVSGTERHNCGLFLAFFMGFFIQNTCMELKLVSM